MPLNMAITLTPAAADRVRHFLSERGRGIGLRVAVRKTGCSGFAYVVNYADAIEPGDRVFDSQGVQVLVDPKSAPILEGSTLEFNDALLGGGLKMLNPRATHECACGESFSI